MRHRLMKILIAVLVATGTIAAVTAPPQLVGACSSNGIPTPRPC